MRVLIVKEPESPICSELEKEHNVVIASDLEMALREIKKEVNRFDLVILYSPFSQMAGADFTQEVKTQIPFATVVLRTREVISA